MAGTDEPALVSVKSKANRIPSNIDGVRVRSKEAKADQRAAVGMENIVTGRERSDAKRLHNSL